MGGAVGGERTAFVFAGGGSLGAVQVRMLKALVARGIRPDFVVGSSVGAINAAWFAGRPDTEGAPAWSGSGAHSAERTSSPFPLSVVCWASWGAEIASSIPSRWRSCSSASCRSDSWSNLRSPAT